MIDCYYMEIEKNNDLIEPIFSSLDIGKNIDSNKMSALLTIEEGGVLKGRIEFLRNFYRLGVRMITLTWNYKNEIGSPNYDMLTIEDTLPTEPNTKEGLTPFGIEVVKEMNHLGMVIDCSHIGGKCFYDVIKYSCKPIVCSHSCRRSVASSLRNMTDDMLYKLKENGEVVRITFCHGFVKNGKDFATIKAIVKHINHIKEIIGIDYIGLGSDFDGINNDNIELKDPTYMTCLIEELRKEKYTEEEIDKICFQNVLRVFRANF